MNTVKEQRKYRKCPHCKGKTGFKVIYRLGGHQEEDIDFSGKVLHIQRNGTDDIEHDARCLDCGKMITIEKLEIKNT